VIDESTHNWVYKASRDVVESLAKEDLVDRAVLRNSHHLDFRSWSHWYPEIILSAQRKD
jgi:hypothetical protein